MDESGRSKEKLRTCGEVIQALEEKYGTKDLGTLTRLSAISRSTLIYWTEHPKGPIYKRGRDHVVRVFGAEALPYSEELNVASAPASPHDQIKEAVTAAMRDQVLILHTDMVMLRKEVADLREKIQSQS